MSAEIFPRFDVQGQVALVTGAARGIGRACALALAHAGADVALGLRDAHSGADLARQIETMGRRVLRLQMDVTRLAEIQNAVETTVARLGRLDILVNNAAVRGVSTIDAIDPAEFRRITGIILDGAYICVKACLAALRASGQGAIVNVGGMSGHTGARGRPHVVAGKMGLVGLTRALAHDLAPDNITVNCVVPGLIETVRSASSGAHSAHADGTLVGRRGRPEEIAAAIRFLAGPHARYVTGQDWHVNGGAYLG